jgi:hypothetical protein
MDIRTLILSVCLAGVGAMVTVPAAGAAQADATPEPRPGEVRVFLDCQNVWCDFDYFREQIPFVRYVRDRRDADVHVLVTAQATGAGAREHTIAFLGLGRFEGVTDEQRHISPRDATQDDVRRGLVHTVSLGLVRFVARTPAGERLRVTLEDPPAAAPAAPADPEADPWNLWTFRVGSSGFFSGEQSYTASNLSASASANRTTETWKLDLTLNSRYSESRFEITEDYTVTNIQRNHGLSALVVRSVSPHWSAGGRASLVHSTFLNQRTNLRVAPAVEYNVFPYAESTRRQFTFQYGVGFNTLDYFEPTIFERESETFIDHNLLTTLVLRQPWGSVSTSLEASQYLHDPAKHRLVLFSDLDLRLVRGLSFRSWASIAMLRDQIYLPARGASPEEILLRQRQLATSFRYYGSIGLSYQFGSPFHGVVNPRFRGSPGGMIIVN